MNMVVDEVQGSLQSVDSLLALTFLVLKKRSWMYGGMAIRMAMELGLHEDVEGDDEGNDNETLEKIMAQEARRRLFWTIYTIDK
jgi:cadmium resistance protein CadD (predicted permease)